jgi:hypothetical protein
MDLSFNSFGFNHNNLANSVVGAGNQILYQLAGRLCRAGIRAGIRYQVQSALYTPGPLQSLGYLGQPDQVLRHREQRHVRLEVL